MTYSPSTTLLQRVRSLFQRRINDGTFAVLGNTEGRVEVPDRIGYVYCRFPDGKDANGNALYSTPFIVRASNAAYPNYAGAGVYIAIGYTGELEIKSAHYPGLDSAGIDTRTLNPLHQQAKWVYPWQLTMGLVRAVGTATTVSTLLMVKSFRHYVNNVFAIAETPLEADKIDVDAYIPAVDEHCYVGIWLDTYLNEFVVTTSTAQSLFTPLDATDITELVTDRPPDAIPLAAKYLANDSGSVVQSVLDVDLRQFLDTPTVWGFPIEIDYQERIQPNRCVTTSGTVTTLSTLTILGEMTIL